MQVLQKAQENFKQAQQEVMQAQTDLEMLTQEAPAASDASSTSQREPDQNLWKL